MDLEFTPARVDHAKAIELMRRLSSEDLLAKLGPGPWNSASRLQSVKERIVAGDVQSLRHMTLYIAHHDREVVGSVAVTTFLPAFLKGSRWQDPKATALGVFNLVVPPACQRQGIGNFLMRSVEGLALAHGIRFVRLDAYAGNPYSTAFYRQIGYEERGEIDVRGTRLVLFEKATR